ncbi:GAF domain-containing protein [bacterium]|nr:GAF domain-containing protein [bacterium]
MDRLKAANTQAEVCQVALDLVVERLKPERALIFYGYDANDQLLPQVGHNLDPRTVLDMGDVSLGILQDAMEAGEAKMLVDAMKDPRFGERTSAVLSGIRSVLSCPIRDGNGEIEGLVYLDSRIQSAAFKQADLPWLNELAEAIQQRLSAL